MPRLKIEDDELDVEELDNAEYDDGQFDSYDGEQPPKDTVLRGYVKSVWWTYTKDESPMLKVLWIADGNTGDEEEYDGLPIWENMALTAKAKFKWAPFFEQFGLTMRLVKTKAYIADDDDNIGTPITKIDKFIPGKEARCGVITSRERYNGRVSTHVKEWLDDFEPEDEEDEKDEEETPPPPARRSKGAADSTAKTSAPKAAAGRPSAKSVAAKAPRGRKAKDEGYDDEPPF
jgi:hypothetical protein